MKFKQNLLTVGLLILFVFALQLTAGELLNVKYFTYKGKIKPVTSQENDKSPFGIQFDGMPFHESTRYEELNVPALLKDLPDKLNAASELGLKWARVSVDWSSVEDSAGVLHWELLDPIIKGLVDKEITIYLCLHGGHGIHTHYKPPVTKKQLTAWKAWVRAMVSRYKEKIDYWEIWNEGNSVWFWGGDPKAEEYMQLIRETVPVIHAIDPKSKIVGGNHARVDVPFAEQLFDLGIAKYIDVFTFHPYCVIPAAIVKKIEYPIQTPHWYVPTAHTVDGLQKLINESGKPIELWQGECGYPSAMNSMGWNGTGPWSEAIQAKWILRRGLVDLSYNAKVSTYFVLKETSGSWNRRNFKGLLRLEDQARKPAYFAYQNLIATLQGEFESLSTEDVDIEIIDWGDFPGTLPKNIFTVKLKDDKGQQYLAYWFMLRSQNNCQPGAVNISCNDLDGKQIEFVDLMSGSRYTPSNIEKDGKFITFKGMPIADYPFMIISK